MYTVYFYNIICVYGGFLKWWYPTTMGFPTKDDHFGVFWGYHHFRKHPYMYASTTTRVIFVLLHKLCQHKPPSFKWSKKLGHLGQQRRFTQVCFTKLQRPSVDFRGSLKTAVGTSQAFL